MSRLEHGARVVEYTVASILTLALLALHFSVFSHAGPLWRDEISSLNLATKPTFGELWAGLTFDPVPALFFCLLRLWSAVGWGGTDQQLRLLGLMIGIGVLCAIWVASLLFKKGPPTWALFIFGLSPVTLVWGDSLRAYGLSCLFNIVVIALLWRMLRPQPRPAIIALAAVAALLSVQSIFPNALLLFAAGASGILVAAGQRWWRSVIAFAGVGLVAAASLLLYLPTIHRTQEWSMICRSGIDGQWILTMLYRALSSGGKCFAWSWCGLALILIATVILVLVRPRWLHLRRGDGRLVLYLAATMGIACAGIFVFFRVADWTTSVWYYLPLMGTAAICLDAALRVWQRNSWLRAGNALVVLALAALVSPLVSEASTVRLTNIDLVARCIAEHAQPEDLVVVDNFFYSVSFNRYYHGAAPCLDAPGVSDLSLHRWDLLKQRMTEEHPLQPILDRIDQTLRSGHVVYVAGFVVPNRLNNPPADLGVAPNSPAQWRVGQYIIQWTRQIAYASQIHAEHGAFVPVPSPHPLSEAEGIRAVALYGWKEDGLAKTP